MHFLKCQESTNHTNSDIETPEIRIWYCSLLLFILHELSDHVTIFQGDSGGPIQCKVGDKWHLVGKLIVMIESAFKTCFYSSMKIFSIT